MRIRMQQPLVRTANSSIARPAPKTAAPVYLTAEHARWRAAVIARAGGHCQGKGCTHVGGGRLYADHIVELRDGGQALELSNGQALCASCHTRKTNRERERRQRGERPGGGSDL